MRAMGLMHNVMTLCGLDYEYGLIDANKDLSLKKFDSFVKGPREVFKGISDLNTWIGDSKLRKDAAKYPISGPEDKKELKRVLDGETQSNAGRHKFHDMVDGKALQNRSKARERFQNEPFH